MVVNLSEMKFPSEAYSEEEEIVTRRCTSFGEAAIMIANDPNILGTTDFFNCFYNGFSENSTIWFAYRDDDDSYENHFKLQLSTWKNDKHATNSMKEIISPRILLANFTSGRDTPTFEFYYPSVAAKQLGFGQVPPLLFFADKVQIREVISDALAYNRLKNLEPDIDTTQLADWQIMPFSTIPFTHWWSEWQEHLFCKLVNLYCIALNENYQATNDEV